MPTRWQYPESTDLRRIERTKLPRFTLNSPIFRHFPFAGANATLLKWKQKDNFGGMMLPRGLNGMPPRVAMVGEKEFIFRPGAYGEHIPLDEEELTERAADGNEGTPIPVDDLVTQAQDTLLVRRLNRIEWLCWQVVLDGMFIAHNTEGAIVHKASFAIQEHNAAVDFSDRANAKPLEELTNVSLLGRGTGTDFGAGAIAYANRVTANHIARNTNAADLGGKLIGGGNKIASLNDVNQVLTGDGLPNIQIYDEGYEDSTGTWTPYIPDGKMVVIGRLMNGEQIGEFRFTRNLQNAGGAPTPYTKVFERSEQVPFEVEIHDGFNGGVVLYYPGAVVTMNVG